MELLRSEADSQARILLVDDEPLLLQTLSRIVASRGHETELAASGAAALQALEQGGFDLVLLDFILPDMSGDQVMQAMTERGHAIPVIVVSGDASINSAIEAFRCGAYDFIRKPYEAEELLRKIDNVMHKRRLERENKTFQTLLQASERRYRYLVNSSPDIIYTLDRDGRFTFLNDRVEGLLGYQKDELIGQHYTHVVHQDDLARVTYVFNERRTGMRASRNIGLRLKHKDGIRSPHFETRFLCIELNAMGMYGDDPHGEAQRFLGTYGVARDVSDRKQAEETIAYQAYHDLLTGLSNRYLFRDRLTLAIAQAKRNGHMLAVMFLDLDNFKVVNDTLGHVVGDELLQGVAARLKSCLRESDTLSRIGGDEFTLLLPQIGDAEDAQVLAEKMIAVLRRPFSINGHELFVRVSIGIALCPADGETMDSLIKSADIAMYHAKARGRDNLQFFATTMNAAFSGRLSMENSMRRALERNEFVVHYQPQVDLESGAIVGAEALIRWQSPTLGLVSPSDFIPLAEETGLIVPIGHWVLGTVCAQAGKWRDMGLPPLRLAVNLSSQQIEKPDLVDCITRALETNRLESRHLEIEITESSIMKDVENTIYKLRQLGEIGVKISIDDFGTGYSSLSYLKKFPVHTIKIDQSFVGDIEKDSGGTSIVTAIIAMAKGLKLNLVAEGVETPQQLAFLRRQGCNEAQGYLVSMPLSAEEFTRLLQEKGAALHFGGSDGLGENRRDGCPRLTAQGSFQH
jgi:diguanylate cyclase (GGDEF)-like protein/PAS domain S-box-containing protein